MARIFALVTALLLAAPAAAQVVTLEDLALPPNSSENGRNLAGSFTSGGAVFNNSYSSDPVFGDSWSGWSYSTVRDTTTPGFTNQYAAYANLAATPAGGGDGSATYAVAYAGAPTIGLPAGTAPASVRLTNTTYAALSMQTGDQFAKKFGGVNGTDPDFFLLTITGQTAGGVATGTVEFYLADFRSADSARDTIVSDWTTVDLSGLGAGTARLGFAFTSSDVGPFGINTPTYVALDNLTLTPVPEPAGLLLTAAGFAAIYRKSPSRVKVHRFSTFSD